MTRKHVSYEIEGEVATITINHPPVNVLDPQTIEELGEVFRQLEEMHQIRVVIITGAGEKTFVAGADITVFPTLGQEEAEELAFKVHETFNRMQDSRLIVLGAINGLALGGGCELALACDIRIASENAQLGQPEVNLAIIPGGGGTQRLTRLVGIGKAKELIMTGDIIDAKEAKRIGLVDEVVAPGEALTAARKMAEKIITKGPLAIVHAKRVINQGLDLPLREALDLEVKVFGKLFKTGDQKEGAKAFLEKRVPNFKGG